jgi:hypothetical protein
MNRVEEIDLEITNTNQMLETCKSRLKNLKKERGLQLTSDILESKILSSITWEWNGNFELIIPDPISERDVLLGIMRMANGNVSDKLICLHKRMSHYTNLFINTGETEKEVVGVSKLIKLVFNSTNEKVSFLKNNKINVEK